MGAARGYRFGTDRAGTSWLAAAQPALEQQDDGEEAEDKQEFTGAAALERGPHDQQERRERQDRSRDEDERAAPVQAGGRDRPKTLRFAQARGS